jgi:hypothetical protein
MGQMGITCKFSLDYPNILAVSDDESNLYLFDTLKPFEKLHTTGTTYTTKNIKPVG